MACTNVDTPAGWLTQTAAEGAVLCLINEQRAAVGVAPLTLNLRLQEAARQHARDSQAIRWWFEPNTSVHVNPVTNATPQTRISDAGYCPGGEQTVPPNENCYTAWFRGGLEFASGTTAQAAVDWWMDSAGHKSTLLNPDYTETGVAVVLGTAQKGPGPDTADGGVIIVQTFGSCSVPEPALVGELWAWGRNDQGQVGDGSTVDWHQAVHLEGLDEVGSFATGRGHSLAIRSDGSLLAWGGNYFGELGDGTTTNQLTPVAVSLTEVQAVSAGNIHSLALRRDGTVWAWGGNYKGQLGDGTTADRILPGQVTDLLDIVSIRAGWQANLALTSEGSVYAWGENNFGQLGIPAGGIYPAPVLVESLTRITAISAGMDSSLALRDDGTVWAWGANYAGQLGDGTHNSRPIPQQVQIPKGSGPIVAIAAGGMHSMALEQNGQLWVWGNNSYGSLGIGYALGDSVLPVRPIQVFEVTEISAGFAHCVVLKKDGSLWAWGKNSYGGALGDNTIIDRSEQVKVVGLPYISSIATGSSSFHTLAS